MADAARFLAALERVEAEYPEEGEGERAIHAVFLALEPQPEDLLHLSQVSWVAGAPGRTEAGWRELPATLQLVEHDRVTAILTAYFDGVRHG